jgi:hypothetical protein
MCALNPRDMREGAAACGRNAEREVDAFFLDSYAGAAEAAAAHEAKTKA